MIETAPLHLFAHLDSIEQDHAFDAMHPGVFVQFAQLARQVRRSGLARYSADALLHRLRWHYQIDSGDPHWKANNSWTAYLARRLMREHAQEFGPRDDYPGFFETRRTNRHSGARA